MNEFVYEMVLRVTAYFMFVVIIGVLFNLLTSGFFMTYARVKLSMGKKVLVNIRGYTRRYYRVGEIVGSRLRFKDRSNNNCSIAISEGAVSQLMSVSQVEIDEIDGSVILPNNEKVTGSDPAKIDAMIERALSLRGLSPDKLAIITIVLLIIVIGGLFWLNIQIMSVQDSLLALVPKGSV